jgi:DNA-binding beta-propeller fold protein YncE
MFYTFLLRHLKPNPAGTRARQIGRKATGKRRALRGLHLERLEDRLCLSLDMLVSSYGNNSVLRYDGTTGAFLGEFVPPGSGDLDGPHGLVFGLDGNLLVASEGNDKILRYDQATGGFLGDFVPQGTGGLSHPHGMVFGPDNNLYVSSAGSHSVLRFDGTTGAYLGAFVPPSAAAWRVPLA